MICNTEKFPNAATSEPPTARPVVGAAFPALPVAEDAPQRKTSPAEFEKSAGSVNHPVTGLVVPPHGLGEPALDIPAYDDPRSALVDWMSRSDNPYFARAFVN